MSSGMKQGVDGRRWSKCLTVLALASLFVVAPQSAVLAEDLPSTEQVLDDYIKATGGREAYEKHHNMVMEGTLEVVAMGLKASLKSYSAAPNKSRTVMEFQGMGKAEEGSDGQVCWSSSAMEGPRVVEGEERDFQLRLGTFNPELNWKQMFEKAECVSTEDIEGKTCYKVVFTPATGKPMIEYFDKETKLLVRVIMTVPTPMGEMLVESSPSDYRDADGVLAPFKSVQNVAGTSRTMIVSSVQFNVELPPDVFDPPAEVKALLNKKAESGKAPAGETP